MKKPYRAYLLSSEYNHHVYAKAPALAYSFQELGDEVSLVGILLLIQQYFDIVDYVIPHLRKIKSHTCSTGVISGDMAGH
jgi:hypothetical protein